MKQKSLVVIRRYGYYVNIVPNEESVLTAWIRDNVPFGNMDLFFEKDRPSLEKRGYSFTPINVKDVQNVKTYSRRSIPRN